MPNRKPMTAVEPVREALLPLPRERTTAAYGVSR